MTAKPMKRERILKICDLRKWGDPSHDLTDLCCWFNEFGQLQNAIFAGEKQWRISLSITKIGINIELTPSKKQRIRKGKMTTGVFQSIEHRHYDDCVSMALHDEKQLSSATDSSPYYSKYDCKRKFAENEKIRFIRQVFDKFRAGRFNESAKAVEST